MEQRRICILSKNTIECANDKELDKLLQDSTSCNQRCTLKYEYPGRYYKKPYASKEEYKRYKKQRKNMRRKIGKLRARVMNIKKDIHWKISRHITLNNKHITISRFQVSQMTNKLTRNKSSKVQDNY